MPRQPECVSSSTSPHTEGLCVCVAKGATHTDTQPRLLAVKAIVRDPPTSTREQWTNVVVGWLDGTLTCDQHPRARTCPHIRIVQTAITEGTTP
jgi:hypothetical protein